MKTFTVTLSDAEFKALAHSVLSPQDWIDNAVHERCRLAMEEIFIKEVQRMISDPNIKEIPADREAIVLAADIISEADRQASISNIEQVIQ